MNSKNESRNTISGPQVSISNFTLNGRVITEAEATYCKIYGNVTVGKDYECIGVEGRSDHGIIQGNDIYDNRVSGITLENTNNCITIENSVHDTRNAAYWNYALHLERSKDNIIYHNNFYNNDKQVWVSSGYANVWDNGAEGNYWDDYDGTDSSGDGIGDTPYIINYV